MIGLGSANLGIGIAVTLRNAFTGPAQRITASMRDMNKEQRNLLHSNLIGLRNMGAGVAAIGVGMAMAFNQSVKEVGKFHNTLQGVKANTGLSTKEMNKLKYSAMDLGIAFGAMPQEVANAMKDVSKAVDIKNLGRKGIFNLTKDALLLGKIGETDIGGEKGSAEILINIMSQFELQANRSREVVDKLAMTANKTTTDVKGLAEAFKYGGAEAHRLGLNLDETLAFFGIMGQSGLKGSLGGTTGGNFLRYLTKAVGQFRTERQSEGLAMIGLRPEDIMDTNGNLLKLDVVLTRIRNSLKGMNNVSRQNAMEAIFGVRGSRAETVLHMLDKANFGAGFKELLKYLQNSKGYAAMQMAVRMQTYEQRVKQFNAALFTLKEALVTHFVPFMLPVLQKLTATVKWLAEKARTPIGKFIVILGGVTIALATIGGLISMITGGLGALALTSRTSFTGMANAAKWAFRMMGLEAMIFQRKAQGALIFNEGLGRWTNGRTGRMVSKRVAERYQRMYGGGKTGMLGKAFSFLTDMLPFMGNFSFKGGARGMFGGIGGLGRSIGGLSGGITRLLPSLLRFGGLIGAIVTVLGVVVGWRNLFDGITYAIGTFLQAIYGGIQFLNPLSDTFMDWSATAEEFSRRQFGLKQSLGWTHAKDYEEQQRLDRKDKFYSPYVSKAYDEAMDRKMRAIELRYTQRQQVNVNMDGRKISEHTQKYTDNLFVKANPVK
jgi:TP901 family phage tail tape measure protein